MDRFNITRKEAFEEGTKSLIQEKIPEARLDAWLLLSNCLKISKAEFYSHPEKALTDEEQKAFWNHIEKRKSRMPCQYIIGNQEFMGLEFLVKEGVLIPRQDTEVLVEEALKVSTNKRVLDMCTGTGCILISLAKHTNLAYALGTDVSKEAISVAKENARLLDADVEFLLSDMWERIEGKFDVIISNPPYIKSKQLDSLMPEVGGYEPRLALDGGMDGLDFYRRIIDQAGGFLNKNGKLLLEIDCHMGEIIGKTLQDKGFGGIRVIKDLAGLDRVVTAIVPTR